MRTNISIFVIGTIVGVALLMGGLWAYQRFFSPPRLSGITIDSPKSAYDFTLRSMDDRTIRLSDYRGKVVALYFGYTFCPDVCPKTLNDIAQALKVLGDDAQGVQLIFVSVDPERDTPTRANLFAQGYNPTFIGATADPDTIAYTATQYGITYQRIEAPTSAAGYLMNHSAVVTLIDRQGQLKTLWPFDTSRDDMVSDLRALLEP